MKSSSLVLAGIIISLNLLSHSPEAKAQNTFLDQTEFTMWSGYSFKSMRLFGKTIDSQTEIIGVGFSKFMRTIQNDKYNLYYTGDLIPHIKFYYPKRDDAERRAIRNGFGISPIGFILKRNSSRPFNPYIQTTGSFIYMNKEFPTDNARKLNFTFDVTIAGELKIWRSVDLSMGYKFHHISNAETGSENPGLDSNFIFASINF